MRAAVYVRVSTEEQAKHGISIQAQIDSIEHYCKSKGWEIVDIYPDDGYSAKNLNRPAMQQLLADATRSRFDVAVAWKLDRFTRKLYDLLHLVDHFTRHNVDITAVQDSIDTSTKEGKLLLHILGSLAEWERETIIERAREAAAYIARQGRWKGGTPPYGYIYIPRNGAEPGRLEPDPEKAKVVKLIFDLACERQWGSTKIARYLNGENARKQRYPTPGSSQRWMPYTIGRILNNPIYAGWIVRYVDEKKGVKEVYEGQHEPIISREQWQRAQAVLNVRRITKRQKRGYLLSGLLRCGSCGRKLTARKNWTNWPRKPKKFSHSYVCLSRVMKGKYYDPNAPVETCPTGFLHGTKLERRVLEEILRYVQNPEALKAAYQRQFGQVQADPGQDEIEKELQEVKKRLDRWAEIMEAGDIDLVTFKERVKALEERRKALEAQLASSQAAASAPTAMDEFVNARMGFYLQLMGKSYEEVRQTVSDEDLWHCLRMLVQEVVVAPDGSVKEIIWQHHSHVGSA